MFLDSIEIEKNQSSEVVVVVGPSFGHTQKKNKNQNKIQSIKKVGFLMVLNPRLSVQFSSVQSEIEIDRNHGTLANL